MATRTAYGSRERIDTAITEGIIPKDCLIVTKEKDSELLFYDKDGNLLPVSERVRFETFSEADKWISKYGCAGNIVSVHNGTDWVPYVVQESGELKPISASIDNITFIDGGNAPGL